MSEEKINLEEIESLREMNDVLMSFFAMEASNGYSLFHRSNKNLEIPNFNSFKKYKILCDILVAHSTINDYHARQVRYKLLCTLLLNADYAAKTEPDFDAEYAIEWFEGNSWLSKKDQATLARHLVITNDMYLEHIQGLSIYFNTLKKNNPELKDSSVKLMNEVMGAKVKKTASKQEKLERREGLLWAYKNFTPEDIYKYPDSFDWHRIRSLREDDHCDNLGRSQFNNDEFFEYVYNGGPGYLREATKVNHKYDMSYHDNTELVRKLYRSFDQSCIERNYGNIPINHIYGPFDTQMNWIASKTFPEFWDNGTDIRAILLQNYFNYVVMNNYETTFMRNFVGLDFSYDLDEEVMRKVFIHFAYLEEILKLPCTYSAMHISKSLDVTIGEFLHLDRETQSYYTRESNIKRIVTSLTLQNINSLTENANLLGDKIFKLYMDVRNNPKTADYMKSDKYWIEFNSIRDERLNSYNDDTVKRNYSPIKSRTENASKAVFMIPEAWEELSTLINNS